MARETVKCFKKLCLRADNQRAKEVIDYYILLEDKYREYALERNEAHIRSAGNLEEKDDKGETTKVRKYKLGESIYVIEIKYPEGPGYRIGRTKDFNRRLRDHSRFYNPLRVTPLLHVMFPTHFLEECLHDKLKQYWIPKEDSIEVFDADIIVVMRAVSECHSMYIHGQVCDSGNATRNNNSMPFGVSSRDVPADPDAFVLPSPGWGTSDYQEDRRRKIKKSEVL